MAEGREKKKGFWGIFRSPATARRPSVHERESPPARTSEGDGSSRRRRTDSGEERGSPRPRRRPPPLRKSKPRDDAATAPAEDDASGPLKEWPPDGVSLGSELSEKQAASLIAKGVPVFEGHRRSVPHAPDRYYALFATVPARRGGEDTDTLDPHDNMTQPMTLRLPGRGHTARPWESLEQPSYAFYFGSIPGTVTLNQFVSASSNLPRSIPLRDSGVSPRDVDILRIFARLRDLEMGLEEGDEAAMYKSLYKGFLRDPDRILNPHKTIDKQITDLIVVLSRPGWIDFTDPRNHVVTRFIFDTHPTHPDYFKFFHQLLLSIELDLRINANMHGEWAKEKLLVQLPPTIQWSLALARRWRENVRIEDYGRSAEQLRLRFRHKRRYVKSMKRFAQLLKWPNLDETLEALREKDADGTLPEITVETMAFFSGLVLPGNSYPFILMNALVDVDPDRATDHLTFLSHLQPNCGFQYRSSYTYWTVDSIVGKVLAPTCRSVGGWVGPAQPTDDLERSQIARLRPRRPKHRISPEDTLTMSERSDPLGPSAEVYPVKEYMLVLPDVDGEAEPVKIELLSFKPIEDLPTNSGPGWFEPTVQFAIGGVSWPLKLGFDVSFVSAWPCSKGPHPLFFDYIYERKRADQIVSVEDWGGLYSRRGSAQSVNVDATKSQIKKVADEEEQVLVVEAFGPADNEVLVRAWCAHWGLHAVVADIQKTCVACAIREAYAATITVVILIDGSRRRPDGNEK